MTETRAVFKGGVSSTIYTNTTKLIKGDTVKDRFLVLADSILFLEDANVAGGFLSIDSVNSIVDTSFIKSTSPTGKFLKDDGTWTSVNDLPSQTGNSGKFLTTNGSSASWAVISSLPSLTLTATSGNTLTVVDGSSTPQLFIDSTHQFAFNAGSSGPIYFGAFNNPSAGLAGFSVPGYVIMGISAASLRAGFGGVGAYYASNEPAALVDVNGKADELQLLVSASDDQTNNILQVMASNRSTNYLTVQSNGYLNVSTSSSFGLDTTATATAFVDITAATSDKASLRIRGGEGTPAPDHPNEGDIWQDGTNIYIYLGGSTKTFNLT